MELGVYLEHIRVRNFRNLRAVNVWLRPGYNVLVGRNNTGKSNLFQAIRHALGPVASPGDWLPPLSHDDLFHDGAAHVGEPIRIDLSFTNLSRSQRAQFFEVLDYDTANPSCSRARIHFEAHWDSDRQRYHRPKRWGGAEESESEVPYELIRALPVTFLPALRDAEQSLSPGRASRIARLLEDLARARPDHHDSERIQAIFRNANDALETDDLIREAVRKMDAATRSMAGSDYVGSSITATGADFNRIVQSLQILLEGNPVRDLRSSGLGYKNLLFTATILSHLRESSEDEVPLLLIEEPEAHLHPQLVERLGRFLAGELPGRSEIPPQTIVATHSPTLASKAMPRQVSVMFASGQPRQVECNSLARLGLSDTDERALSRMLDISRAAIFFAKGLILVEGVSEELLVPAFARLLGYDLSQRQVSVVPLFGVAFSTLGRILGGDGLGIPVSIITDGDPPVQQEGGWETAVPKTDSTGFLRSPRTEGLLAEFNDHPNIRVFTSQVTLEFDCAAAGPDNIGLMMDVWEQGYPRGTTVNRERIEGATDKPLELWRGICRAHHGWSKAEFAHLLAARLEDPVAQDRASVPSYIQRAIEYVCSRVDVPGEPDPVEHTSPEGGSANPHP